MIGSVARIFAIGMITLLIARVPASAQADCGPGRVGYVQRAAVIAMLPRYATRDTELNVDIEEYKFELNQQQGRLDSAAAAYRAKAALISASASAVEYQKLQNEGMRVQRDLLALKQKIAVKRQLLFQPLDMRLQATLDSIRTEVRCSIILDPTAATGVVSVNKAFDLTQRVIDRLTAARDTAWGPWPKRTGDVTRKPPPPPR